MIDGPLEILTCMYIHAFRQGFKIKISLLCFDNLIKSVSRAWCKIDSRCCLFLVRTRSNLTKPFRTFQPNCYCINCKKKSSWDASQKFKIASKKRNVSYQIRCFKIGLSIKWKAGRMGTSF